VIRRGAPSIDAGGERLLAPAKLTLSLRVVGARADGYHLIDAEMTTLDLADVLTISPAPRVSLDIGGPFAAGVPTDETNLVVAAMALVGQTAAVHIDKHIPNGGGLGGGSADAAAVLRWGGIADPGRAVRLGADVAFCLVGGRARVTGIGEHVDVRPARPGVVTLVVPPLHVSTPAVYRAWDDLGGPTAAGPNDLEPAALAVEPRLAGWRRCITELAGTAPVLAGSGATWFVHGRRDDDLAPLRADGATVLVATTA